MKDIAVSDTLVHNSLLPAAKEQLREEIKAEFFNAVLLISCPY
jgi:hypothetical protein